MQAEPATPGRGREGVVSRLRQQVGLWSSDLERLPMRAAVDAVRQVEDVGFSAFWFPGDAEREPISTLGAYLAATSELVVGPAVASIHARDARAAAGAQRVLHELYGSRQILGLGVSHQSFVEDRGHEFPPPVRAMVDYLQGMRDQRGGHRAPPDAVTLVAALGPRMLAVAARLADGAFSYNGTVEHTRLARDVLGPDPLLAVTQIVIDASSPEGALATVQRYLSYYCGLPNYVAHWKRLGFDLESGSDQVLQALGRAITVWGPPAAIMDRVLAHRQAGADHVALQIVRQDRSVPLRDVWQALGSLLDGSW